MIFADFSIYHCFGIDDSSGIFDNFIILPSQQLVLMEIMGENYGLCFDYNSLLWAHIEKHVNIDCTLDFDYCLYFVGYFIWLSTVDPSLSHSFFASIGCSVISPVKTTSIIQVAMTEPVAVVVDLIYFY